MKKILFSLALLFAGTAQAALNKTIPTSQGQGFIPTTQSTGVVSPVGSIVPVSSTSAEHPIAKVVKEAITNVDPKNPANVAKAHAIKATILSTIGSSTLIAPETQRQLTNWVNSLESAETLFVIGGFLMTLLHHIEHYRNLYHSGASLTNVAKTPAVPPQNTPVGYPGGMMGQQKPHIPKNKTHFAPGEVIENYASNGGGAGTEYATFASYSSIPTGSIQTSPWGVMPGNSGNITIRVSPNAKPGVVKIYQTTGEPGATAYYKKKLYRTITVTQSGQGSTQAAAYNPNNAANSQYPPHAFTNPAGYTTVTSEHIIKPGSQKSSTSRTPVTQSGQGSTQAPTNSASPQVLSSQ